MVDRMMVNGIATLLISTLLPGLSPRPVWADEKPPETIEVEELAGETAEATVLKTAVEAEVDAISPRIIEISDWLYHNPETGHIIHVDRAGATQWQIVRT